MVKTAEQKVRDRYRADLENGKTPRALTDANRAILEEIRAEVAAGCQYVQAAVSSGRKRIREAGDEQVRRVEQGDGLAYHDGFLRAKKAFAAGFCQAALHSFVSNSWLRQCAERAGLSEAYNARLAARDSYGLLGDLSWAPSSDMR